MRVLRVFRKEGCAPLYLAVLAMLMGSGLAVDGARAADGAVVRVEGGDLQGNVAKGVQQFLGIPFALPPVGDLRWKPPVPADKWTGTRDATKYASFCAQPKRGIFAAPSDTEDCLYLNVFAPDPLPSRDSKLPVMVWFYGGGLFSGESNDYDGSKLAKRGHVIVVTPNYRVGPFGFISVPSLNSEGHAYANYGIMDQQAALKWVQANIANFGGDAGNVTIFGQSGGGTSVMANLQSPAAKGLFQRAINESGTRIKVFSPDFALKKGEEFAEKAGCPDASAACLRGLSTKAVMDAQAPIRTYVTDFPTVDGKIITKSALDAYRSGDFNRVPILTGLVQDEQSFFVPEVLLGTKEPLTQKGYDNYLASFGSEHQKQLEKKYPVEKYETPTLAEIAVAQKSKACTARMLNKAWQQYVPVYAYEFRDRTAPSYYPKYSFPFRAYHTAELQYLFPFFHGGGGTPHPLNADQEKLSDQIIDYWTSFARDGVPKARTSALKSDPWKPWTPGADNVQYLTLTGGHQHNGYGVDNDCDIWDGVLSFK